MEYDEHLIHELWQAFEEEEDYKERAFKAAIRICLDAHNSRQAFDGSEDAVIGRIFLKYLDRLMDPAEFDNVETVVEEMLREYAFFVKINKPLD